jgi:protease-4
MVASILAQVRAAERDPDMRAIILEVNSPGGGVTPSDEIYNALRGFRNSRPDRRVVVFIRDLGASGAYYAAMAGDFIIAEPTAVVGSIGVIMQTMNFQGLSEKLGITDVTIKSGANKDMLNPFQAVNTNQVALLQTLIDEMQTRFRGIVAESRKLDPSTPDLFDGRIFSASDALKKGLIDEVGYWNDALACTAQLLDTGALRVVRYEPQRTFFEQLLEGKSPVVLPGLKLHSPQFLYLWKP